MEMNWILPDVWVDKSDRSTVYRLFELFSALSFAYYSSAVVTAV